MDKNAIKKYAVWARNELIARVSQRAQRYGITEEQIIDANADSVNGIILTDTEKKQRQALIQKIKEKGFEQVVEEVAYTWFNRFSALRFMEVNGYLPSHVRVFTDQNNAFKPEIISEAIHLDLDGLDIEKVYALKEANNDDELFKYLIITQCNDLSKILPGMFQKIADYTELLFPDNLLREGSAIEQMIALIPEEDWKDQVQIIGWLYQYYNSEPKDQVFADLKKNKKITKEKIPAATQLFTPDWIVRYMVENSLGRLWVEGHPNDELKSQWKYYLDEAEQELDVQKQLTEIRKEYSALKPEEIKCIDPCCGSGHILAYMFDVLIQIYGAYGISARDAVASIVKNNIYGLDIDERAAQLAQFSVMMKARQYDRRFFSRDVQPNVYAIEDSNGITSAPLHDMGIGLSSDDYGKAAKQIMKLIDEFHDAKEYGSIINVSEADWDLLQRFAVPRWMSEGGQISFEIHGEIDAAERLQKLITLGHALSQKYDVVVTNPPYMGGSGMSTKLSDYVKEYHPNSKYDLFAVFIEICSRMLKKYAFQAMVTMHTWMFISSFERFRTNVLNKNIINIVHHGAKAFENDVGTIVQTVSFVIRNAPSSNYEARYVRLVDYESSTAKEKALYGGYAPVYYRSNEAFNLVPGQNMAYWLDEHLLRAFSNEKIEKVSLSDGQTKTGDNDKYLRKLWEIDPSKIGKEKKWSYIAKGGSFRKWYGNIDTVIDWSDSARSHYRKDHVARIAPEYIWFRHGFVFNHIAETSKFAVRELRSNTLFETAAPAIFIDDESKLYYVMGYLNTWIAREIIIAFNPTYNTNVRDITSQPIIWADANDTSKVVSEVKECISLCKDDWDSFETSADFSTHPFLKYKGDTIEKSYINWEQHCNQSNDRLRELEVSLNEFFTHLYSLDQCKMNNEIKIASLYTASKENDVRSFISYAVGCMFGRYSPDKDGIVYAGGLWDPSEYNLFTVDKDNIIPICDDEYFADDATGRFIDFIKTIYGTENLEENLKFIASALGGKDSPRLVIRRYFLEDFYSDHLKTYQKRPIYWFFDSGKKNGFKCLIYMHRYQPDTIARIRTDYVHEQQSRYRTAIADLEQRIESASTSDRVKLSKKLKHLQEQSAEIHDYEEKIHHLADQYISIDLDDGVKVNYAKFQDVLAKIK